MFEMGIGGGNLSKQSEQSLTSTTKKLNDVSTALTKLSKVTDAAASSLKKAQKGVQDLFSFDEINRLSKLEATSSGSSSGSSKKSSSGGSGSGGSSQKLGILQQAAQWLERLKTLAAQLAAPLVKIWELNGGKVVEAFQKLQESAGNLAEVVKGGLQWGYKNVLLPLAEWAIGEAAPAALEALAGAFDLVAAVLKVLAPVGQAIWDHFLRPLAEWTGGAIVSVLKGVGTVFEFLAEKLEKFSEWLSGDQSVWEALANLAAGIGNAVTTGIPNALKQAGTALVQWLKDFLSNIPGLNLVIGMVTSKSPSELWQEFKEKWGNTKLVEAGVKLVKNGWSSLSGFVGNKVPAAVSLTKNGWKSLSSFVGSSVSVGIKLVKSGWTSVKKWLGDLTAKFNIQLPKVSVTWSGSPIALPKFSVKWNAQGGILDGATLFGMAGNTLLGGGEAGREAVLPLDRNTGWMDTFADKVAQRVGGGSGGSGQPIVVQVVLDGKVIGQTSVNYINGVARSTGVNPLSAYI